MLSKFENILSESSGLSSEARQMLSEAWEHQITEARSQIALELREEFSNKFQHDKSVLVESLDKFVSDKLRVEFEGLAEDKKSLIAEKEMVRHSLKEQAEKLDKMVAEKLVEQVESMVAASKKISEKSKVMEAFVLEQLTKEIADFRNDKIELQKQRVALIKEGKEQINQAKDAFVKKAAALVESKISTVLSKEISQYKEDIIAARNNDFGRRIFESFAGEYMTSYLNEASQVAKLNKELAKKEESIKMLEGKVNKQVALTESINTELKVAKELSRRSKVLGQLLAPLGKEKGKVMEQLLESVKTENLNVAFDKYLPVVLNEQVQSKKSVLAESVVTEKTGNKKPITMQEDDNLAQQLDEIKVLAGIKL